MKERKQMWSHSSPNFHCICSNKLFYLFLLTVCNYEAAEMALVQQLDECSKSKQRTGKRKDCLKDSPILQPRTVTAM